MPFQGLNECRIIGYVAKDPDVYETSTGKKVANFTIPTSRKWGDQVVTEWHKCVAWGKLAEVVLNYVNKGSQLHVSGSMTTKTWEKDGVKHYQSEILVDKILMLGGKGKKAKPDEEEAPYDNQNEVPF